MLQSATSDLQGYGDWACGCNDGGDWRLVQKVAGRVAATAAAAEAPHPRLLLPLRGRLRHFAREARVLVVVPIQLVVPLVRAVATCNERVGLGCPRLVFFRKVIWGCLLGLVSGFDRQGVQRRGGFDDFWGCLLSGKAGLLLQVFGQRPPWPLLLLQLLPLLLL